MNRLNTADEAVAVRGFRHSVALSVWRMSPHNIMFPLESTTVAHDESPLGFKRMEKSSSGVDGIHRFYKIDVAALILPTLVVTLTGCRSRADCMNVDSVQRVCQQISAQEQKHRNYRFTYDENVVACKLNRIWPATKQDAMRSAYLFAALTLQLPLAIADRIAKYELVLRAPLAIDFLCSRRKRRQILMDLGAEWRFSLPLALPETIEAGTGGISLCGYGNLIVRLHPAVANSEVELHFWELRRISALEYECFWPRVFRVPGRPSFVSDMPGLALLLRATRKADAEALGKMAGRLQLTCENEVLVDCLPICALREARRAGLGPRWFAIPLCDFAIEWNRSPSLQNPKLRNNLALLWCRRAPISLAYVGCARETQCFKRLAIDMFIVQWLRHKSTPSHYGSVYV